MSMKKPTRWSLCLMIAIRNSRRLPVDSFRHGIQRPCVYWKLKTGNWKLYYIKIRTVIKNSKRQLPKCSHKKHSLLDAEFFDERVVLRRALLLEILQMGTAIGNHLQQPSARVMILLVVL